MSLSNRTALLSLILWSATSLTPALAQDSGSLEVIAEVSAQTGTVNIVLFDSEEAYESGAPVRVARLDVSKGETRFIFEGLPAGLYGLKSFHDVNGNGQMDTNPFGMPIEPYAFSNNAVGNMGPAKWDRARFEVSSTTSQTLNLR